MISPVRFVCVNDDHKSFTCVLHDQYCVFECNPLKFVLVPTQLGISIGSASTCSGYRFLAVSGLPADPDFDTRQVAVFDHTKEEKDRGIFRHAFDEHVLSMRVTPTRLVVAFYKHIEIWDLAEARQLRTIPTAVNVHAPVDVSPGFLAFAGSESTSMALIALDKMELRAVKAADDTVSLVRFSRDGSLVAATSTDGKIVRVFETRSCGCIGKFKRGSTASLIYSIEFSPDNKFMVIVSQSGTLHFFDLEGRAPSSSPPTIRSFQKTTTKQNVVCHLIWVEKGSLSLVMMDGEMINIALDERTCREFGTEQITYLRMCEEKATVL